MLRSTFRSALVALGLAAPFGCATEPGGPLLIGSYGGPGLGLVATDTAAHFKFPCMDGVTPPLRFDSLGVARGDGQVWSSAAGFGSRRLDVSVRASGAMLDVEVGIAADTTRYTEAYMLIRDAAPDFSGVVCLATVHVPDRAMRGE
jgi:hypothetical protein